MINGVRSHITGSTDQRFIHLSYNHHVLLFTVINSVLVEKEITLKERPVGLSSFHARGRTSNKRVKISCVTITLHGNSTPYKYGTGSRSRTHNKSFGDFCDTISPYPFLWYKRVTISSLEFFRLPLIHLSYCTILRGQYQSRSGINQFCRLMAIHSPNCPYEPIVGNNPTSMLYRSIHHSINA